MFGVYAPEAPRRRPGGGVRASCHATWRCSAGRCSKGDLAGLAVAARPSAAEGMVARTAARSRGSARRALSRREPGGGDSRKPPSRLPERPALTGAIPRLSDPRSAVPRVVHGVAPRRSAAPSPSWAFYTRSFKIRCARRSASHSMSARRGSVLRFPCRSRTSTERRREVPFSIPVPSNVTRYRQLYRCRSSGSTEMSLSQSSPSIMSRVDCVMASICASRPYGNHRRF